ncbi:ATP-NAD kinase-like domain-containing protein [Suillus paluster]|uniref:ATP-NAD kinase-like domain-containing protein n=1 Tax=Suillus paluster TaxID=48578 RepID=UPI001B862083|nr:ATP-NAD kinase-like domain-containing protein [Suillus paluster]KAG1756719.1 ATP-NAD kinase-like domain-containing protein [Suillus paluster]
MSPSMRQVLIESRGVSTLLRFDETSFFIEPTELDGHKSSCCTEIFHSHKEVKCTEVPLRNVISAKFATGTRAIEVQYLVRKGKEMRLKLAMTHGAIKDEDSTHVKEWCEALLLAAYQGANPSKNLKVLVNPHGGPGKARAMYVNKVEPIFLAAGCTLDVTYTTHGGHALEIAREMKLGYDAIVILSGDGLIHEVLNGINQHQNREKAFRIPIVPIPTGSANGLSLNLLGLQDGLDVCAASLNVLKGQPLKTDLFSFTQGDRQRISFMSQTIGIMADIDIETEHLRWMGDTRFILGYLRAIIARKSCPIELSMKVVDQDKSRMMDALYARRGGASPGLSSPSSSLLSDDKKLDSSSSSDEEWTRFEKPILWMYAGQGPFVSQTLMQFPVSLADDGLIDISIQEITSRRNLLRAIDGAEEGRTYWTNSNRYFKASSYRARPLAPTGMLVVDGEQVPFEEFQVDVLQGLGTFLSPYPHFAPEFVVQDAHGKSRRTSV